MYYSNGFKNSYEELITFYPSFYRNVFEMQAILETHGRLVDKCIFDINSIVENSFILSADEATISRLESFLRIEKDKNSTLEERRKVVRSYFVGFGKLSASKIKEIIRTFTGADSTISFDRTDDKGNCTLVISMERGDSAELRLDTIESVLAKKIPAHIAYSTFIKYRYPVAISRRRTNYMNEYKLCGLEPEVALLGDKNRIESVTETDSAATSYEVNYRYCGTSVAGTI